MASSYPIIPGVTFKGIPGFPDYCVGDDGTAWSSKRPRWNKWNKLTPVLNPDGYPSIVLYRDRKRFQRSLHCLVLEAFVGPCPPGMEACHDPDHDPLNNRVSNLRWDTHLENMRDVARHGRQRRGETNGNVKLTDKDVLEILRLVHQGETTRSVADRFRVRYQTIYMIVKGGRWNHVTGLPRYEPKKREKQE